MDTNTATFSFEIKVDGITLKRATSDTAEHFGADRHLVRRTGLDETWAVTMPDGKVWTFANDESIPGSDCGLDVKVTSPACTAADIPTAQELIRFLGTLASKSAAAN